MKLWLFLLAMTGILLAPQCGRSQQATACRLRDYKVEPLANGMRIRLKADGMIDLTCDHWLYRWDVQERIVFDLPNLRGADPVVQIGQYPLSHLEFTLLPGDEDGIGMRCTLVFYQPARLTAFTGQPYDYDDTSWVPGTMPQVTIARTTQMNELVITVISDRPTPLARPEIAGIAPHLQAHGTREAIWLDAVHADLGQVAALLEEISGERIRLNDGLSRTVTAYLTALPLDRLLTLLAEGTGLQLARRDDGYYLDTGLGGSAASYRTEATRSIPLANLTPSRARGLLPDMLLPFLRPNPDNNSLAVSGSPAIQEKVARDLQVLDQPAWHCRLRAWVIAGDQGRGDLRDVFAGFAGGNTALTADSDGSLWLGIASDRPDELLLRVRAESTRRQMRVSAVPAIQVTSGNAATLFVGQTIFYWKLNSSGTLKLASVDAGTRLEIRPITSGDWVTIAIDVQNNFLREQNRLGPLIWRNSFTGTLRLRSGEIVLFGGLRLAQDETAKRRPPVRAIAGRARETQYREIYVLLQAETARTPLHIDAPVPGEETR